MPSSLVICHFFTFLSISHHRGPLCGRHRHKNVTGHAQSRQTHPSSQVRSDAIYRRSVQDKFITGMAALLNSRKGLEEGPIAVGTGGAYEVGVSQIVGAGIHIECRKGFTKLSVSEQGRWMRRYIERNVLRLAYPALHGRQARRCGRRCDMHLP